MKHVAILAVVVAMAACGGGGSDDVVDCEAVCRVLECVYEQDDRTECIDGCLADSDECNEASLQPFMVDVSDACGYGSCGEVYECFVDETSSDDVSRDWISAGVACELWMEGCGVDPDGVCGAFVSRLLYLADDIAEQVEDCYARSPCSDQALLDCLDDLEDPRECR